MKLYSLVHDHCNHKSGYMVQWCDSLLSEAGWSWHRTYSGALRSQAVNGGSIYRILSNDHTERVS